MFRLQENVPSIYVDESRDFQLFCRIHDLVNSGVRFDISTIVNTLNPLKANDSILSLYCSRVGFFPKRNIGNTTLRYILSAFPYIIKHKGTYNSIAYAVASILKAEMQTHAVDATYIAIETKLFQEDLYSINIYVPVEIENKVALDELLQYVIPTGFTYNVAYYRYVEDLGTVPLTQESFGSTVTMSVSQSSSVRGSQTTYENAVVERLANSYDTTQVVGSSNYSGVETKIIVGTFGNDKESGDNNE